MIQPKKTTWVLVCDGARARIFENTGPGTGLETVTTAEHPAARASTRELGTDRPGRSFESAPSVNMRHGMAPKADWHELEKEKFAREIASILDDAAKANRFDRVILVAPPATLGELRKLLGKTAAERVAGDIDKDLTGHPVAEIASQVSDLVKL